MAKLNTVDVFTLRSCHLQPGSAKIDQWLGGLTAIHGCEQATAAREIVLSRHCKVFVKGDRRADLTALFAVGQLEERPALLVKHTLVALEALAVCFLLSLPGSSLP